MTSKDTIGKNEFVVISINMLYMIKIIAYDDPFIGKIQSLNNILITLRLSAGNWARVRRAHQSCGDGRFILLWRHQAAEGSALHHRAVAWSRRRSRLRQGKLL